MPLVIPAFGIRAALRRSPRRMTILAPILTLEHAYDDDEADERHQSQHDKGAVSQTRSSVTTEAPYVAVSGVTGSL
jgi:hypothetical protein